MPKKGILYIAMGGFHYACALKSVQSLRKAGGLKLPVAMITDQPVKDASILRINARSSMNYETRNLKTSAYFMSPWDETLYLDADLLVLDNLSKIWEALARANMAMALDRHIRVEHCERQQSTAEEQRYTKKVCRPDAPYFNSGVCLWRRCPEVQRLFTVWNKEWQRFQQIDQKALVRALQITGVKVVVLNPAYNTLRKRGDWPDLKAARYKGVKIMHYIMLNGDRRFLDLKP